MTTAPLWMPPVFLAALVVWIFICCFVLTFLMDLGVAQYPRWITPPAWKALSFALTIPAFFIAAGGVLALGALLVVSVGSIIAHA